jgi:hypothetical protein
MIKQDMEHPRKDDRNDEPEDSPVPDSDSNAEDVSTAD